MANVTDVVEYLEYDFHEAYAETRGTLLAATAAATNKLTYTAHGLSNGDPVSLTNITTLVGVTTATRYYVINKSANDFQLAATPGGTAIAIGSSGSADVYYILRYRFYFPNKIAPNVKNDDFEWVGGGRRISLTRLGALALTMDSASVPIYLHSNVFSKASTAFSDGALVGSNVIGIGGGNDKSGVAIGFYGKCFAKKMISGLQIAVVTRFYWYPVGTLTMTAPRGPESNAVGALQQYTFSASPGNADIMGAAIAGMASDDYYLTGELN